MDQILFVNACARPDSRTYDLARHVLSRLPGQSSEIRLFDERIPPLDWQGVQTRDRAVRSGDLAAPILRYAKQFTQADIVVVAAPYWDLLFPTVVRAYFEAVTVSGITFRYTPEGIPESLCRAKKLIYVTTAGGPIGVYNLGFEYIQALARLYYGIPEIRCFTAEGLDIVGADPAAIMKAAKQAVDDTMNRKE